MKSWDDYKNYVKENDEEAAKIVVEAEREAEIIGAMINQRIALGMSQRDLAALCGMPQSSVARIESMKVTPTLETLLKLLRPLKMSLCLSC